MPRRRAFALPGLLFLCGCAAVSWRPWPTPGQDADLRALTKALGDERRVASKRPGSQYVLVSGGVQAAVARGTDSVVLLLRALDHGDPVVRRNAAIALARLNRREARTPLLQFAADERLSVLETIAVIDAFDSLPGVRQDETVQRVLRQAAERNPAVACAVALELGEIGSPAAADFLALLLTGQAADPEARAAAATSLGTIGLTQAPAHLIAATRDGSPRVRAAAAEALGRIGDPQALSAVTDLLTDDSLTVQRAAITAIGAVGDAESVGPLLLLLEHRIEAVRQDAVAALAALQSVIGLDHALLNEAWRVRRAAVEGLAQIGTDEALRALRRAVDDQDLPVRQAAVERLAASRQFAAVPLLLLALEDEAVGIRKTAHLGLCAIAGQAQPYDYSAPPAARREGLRAWERWWLTANPENIQTPEAIARREQETGARIAAAIQDLADTDPLVRAQAEHRLKGFGPRALPALEMTYDFAAGAFPEAVGDRILPAISEVYRHICDLRAADRDGRRRAALALSRLDRQDRISRTAAAVLVPITDTETDPFTRRFLLDLVAKHSGPDAARIIAATLASDDPWERTKAARLLGERRDRSAVPALIAALDDRNLMARRAAVGALARIGDARAIPPLEGLLNAANVELRIEVAGALAGFRRQAGIDELLRNLAHPNWQLRRLAVEQCGVARLWEALPQLGRCLTDERSPVRDAAADALRAITNQDFGYRPADSAERRDQAVRQWLDYIRDHTPPPAAP